MGHLLKREEVPERDFNREFYTKHSFIFLVTTTTSTSTLAYRNAMDPQLLGLRVLVKLRNPPSSLHGTVAHVQDQRLTLRNVRFLKTGKLLDSYNVHGAEIADIEVVSPEEASVVQAAKTPLAPPRQAPVVASKPPPLPTPAPFVDPAIVGFTRSPAIGEIIFKDQPLDASFLTRTSGCLRD